MNDLYTSLSGTVAPSYSQMLVAKQGRTAVRGGATQRAALLKAGLAHFLDCYQVLGLKAEDRKACVTELKHTQYCFLLNRRRRQP